MSLNWREIALIVSELPLEGSIIQRIHQIGFHALVFELHHPSHGFWELYVEVGTPASRIHRISGPKRQSRRQKTPKLQRFIQYSRAHVEGSRIAAVDQPGRDRLLVWTLERRGEILHLVIRFYSGPGANIILCDRHMVMLELLYRRPGRQEVAGSVLALPEDAGNEDDGRFPVRVRSEGLSFNEQIESAYQATTEAGREKLVERVLEMRDGELAFLHAKREGLGQRLSRLSSYESYRLTGDLLSASMHLIEPGSEWVRVPDYTGGEDSEATIALDPSLSPGENIESYYRRYRKAKTAWEHVRDELEATAVRIRETEARYALMLSPVGKDGLPDPALLEKALSSSPEKQTAQKDPFAGAPGLRFSSGPFTILVGRNAKENEGLLKRWTRGNDWWMHTRDVPGGYVFIQAIAGKSIPLETLLDAGNLAILYSKAKDAGKADLYCTQVKYLKRVKGGKTGLVIPTHEKNVTIQLDDSRVKRLFSTQETI